MISTTEIDAPRGALCQSVGLARATFYRRRPEASLHVSSSAPAVLATAASTAQARTVSPRALSAGEKATVLELLDSPRFCEQAPREVYARLLDEGQYHCSISTMYRILREQQQARERRRLVRHPVYAAPQLLATGPNQVWSWDITKLKGAVKLSYFQLYVILDLFSRYVVGWLLAERESAALAQRLIQETCRKQLIEPGQLTIHADRGSSMKSDLVAQLLRECGIVKSHSRPHVSNDNPFSEAQFKTLKYQPSFPERFGSYEDARQYCQSFFDWYNREHHHSGLGLHTPEQVHYGKVAQVDQARLQALQAAYEAHPERFVKARPQPPALPEAAWINPPKLLGSAKESDCCLNR